MFFTSPILFRTLPFAIYIFFLATNDYLAHWLKLWLVDVRWLYAVKITIVALFLAFFWKHYVELSTEKKLTIRTCLLSLLIGVFVFFLWVLPYPSWAMMSSSLGFDPSHKGGHELDITFVLIRLSGAVLVVPLMEELFWRSFVMRWLEGGYFLHVNPALVGFFAFISTAMLFALAHHLWLAGLIAGLAYGWLYKQYGNLWFSVIAHMVTNGLLGVWIIYNRNWHMW